MAKPIDVLAVAARRLADANAHIRATMAMQAGTVAEMAYWHALTERDFALADMTAVRAVVMAIGEAQ